MAKFVHHYSILKLENYFQERGRCFNANKFCKVTVPKYVI